MSSRKHISLEIGVLKLTDNDYIENVLKNKLDEYSKEIEIEIDYNYGKLDHDLWDMEKVPFELLLGVNNVIDVIELFVPKDHRRNHIATKIMQIVCEVFGKSSLIFMEAGVLKKEYPELKYSFDENDKGIGKKLIPWKKIKERNEAMMAAMGFIDITQLFGKKDEDHIVVGIFSSPLGALAEQYIECYLVTYGKMAFRNVNMIYSQAMYNAMMACNDDNAHIFPLCVLDDDYKIDTVEIGLDDEYLDSFITQEWYSKYDAGPEPSDTVQYATINRTFLTRIGGAEAITEKGDTAIISYPCFYVKASKKNQTIMTGVDKDYPEDVFYSDENGEVVRMLGFALHGDGIWRKRIWYYNPTTGMIYDIVVDPADSRPLAYVGYIVAVKQAEDEFVEAEIRKAAEDNIKKATSPVEEDTDTEEDEEEDLDPDIDDDEDEDAVEEVVDEDEDEEDDEDEYDEDLGEEDEE